MTNKNIVCGYIDCDEPRATSWGWITASNGLDSLNFCSSDHYDTWIEKNAGNFWDLKGLGTDDVTFGPTTIKQEDDGKIEYTCSLSSHITDENKQAIIQSLMTQFQGFHMNPVIVAPQDSYSFKITLDKGEMSPSEIKDKLLWNYFIDKATTRTDAKLLKNLHVDFNKKGSGEGGYPLECYRCGATGSNDKFGYGWQRKCPHCGSYEIHLDRDHEEPAPCMICEKDAKELEEYKKIWKEASTNDLTDTVISLSKNNSQFQGNYAKEKIQWVPIDIVHEMREFDRGGKDAYSGSRDKIDDIKNSLPKNGFMNPLIVDYSMKDRHAYLCEGNHRLIAAQEIGLTHVPVRIIKKENSGNKNRGYAKPVTGVDPDNYGYVPADMSPSQVGMVKENDIIKNTSVNGQGYDAPVDSNLHAPGAQDPEGPQYIIDQANITGPQVEASKGDNLVLDFSGPYSTWVEGNRCECGRCGLSSLDDHHGSKSTYQNYKCRCNECAVASKGAYAGDGLKLAKDWVISHPDSRFHGTKHWTVLGCNCHKCQNNDGGAQIEASLRKSHDELPLPDYVEDENKHQSIANYLKWKYNWNEMDRFGRPISDYSSSDTNKNLSILHGFTTDAWGDKCTCPLCSFARKVPSGPCSSCDRTYDQSLGDRVYILRPGTNSIKKDVWTYNPETNDYKCPNCIKSIKTASFYYKPTDAEKQDARDKGINVDIYAHARDIGATHKEILDVHNNKGIDINDYIYARANNATHNEILDARDKGIGLNNYAYARQCGATHNEIIDAKNKGLDLINYTSARYNGATHNEIIDAHNKGIDLNNYAYARGDGATHNEIIDAHNKCADVGNYALARYHNATHKEILDARDKGIDVYYYASAKENNATHNEILDAHNKGLNLHHYGIARFYNNTHEEAILEQMPNYNPYKELFKKNSLKISSIEPTDAEKQDAHNKGMDVNLYGYARQYGSTHNEIIDAHSKGINVSNYGYARNHGANHKEILDAYDKGLAFYGYGNARNAGATHNEALDAHSKGIDLFDYGDARNYGANHDEALDAHNKGIDLINYGHARNAVATHKEILDAHSKGVYLRDYAYARDNGATHNEIIDAHDKGINLSHYAKARYRNVTHDKAIDAYSKGICLDDYAYARRTGATHKETLDVHSKGIDLINYGHARSNGTTHSETLDAHNKGIGLRDYAKARYAGATHSETIDAHSKGVYLRDYAYARGSGANHNEILDTDSKGIDLINYINARHDGATHEEAILKQMPNYNPYKELFKKNSSIHEAKPYHVSPDYNRESIEEHGLQPNRPHHDWDWEKQWDPGMNVFLSPTDDDAGTWALQIQNTWRDEDDYDDSGREYPHYFDLYHVNTEGLSGIRPGMTDLGKEELVSKAPISPDRITHIKTFDPWYEEEEK